MLITETTIRYPTILLSANVAGEVVLDATVGTDGHVDLRTLKVRRETHTLFTNAVRASLPGWRFLPARIADTAVRSRGVLRFQFVLPSDHAIPREPVGGQALETRWGMDVAVGWRTPVYDPPRTVDATRLYGVIAAIARIHEAVGGRRPLCLEWRQSAERSEPPSTLIEYLREHGAARVPLSQCPRTYSNMILQVDSLGRPTGRPAGAVDPQILSISDLRPWTKDLFVFRYSVWIGNGGEGGDCQAQWDENADNWQISCADVRHFVS